MWLLPVKMKHLYLASLSDHYVELSDSMTTPAGKKTIEAAIEAIAEEQRRRAAKPVLVAI